MNNQQKAQKLFKEFIAESENLVRNGDTPEKTLLLVGKYEKRICDASLFDPEIKKEFISLIREYVLSKSSQPRKDAIDLLRDFRKEGFELFLKTNSISEEDRESLTKKYVAKCEEKGPETRKEFVLLLDLYIETIDKPKEDFSRN